MKTPTGIVALTVAGLVSIAGTGCGKKESPRPAPSGSSPSAANPAPKARDSYSVPALSDEKMAKFLASMQEEKNPLEFVFKPGGGMRNLAEMKVKETEFNAYAHKYGFQDVNEYIDTWGRITVGQMQIGAAKMFQSMAASTEKSIQHAQEQLKKPDLSAEQRQMYTEQIELGRKSLADLTKTGVNSLNAPDLALVEKYTPQIEATQKKSRVK